ncbi:hypothetical protein SAMN04489751_1976 [Brevibacterium sandarakinum]|uniref:Uncharacterized protein n=1 Tax=Brevibacterium sandarakinum TaxID=629680 RepID=A0A1H1S4T5_BRESA|nr:hypothetical protein SAMN04489751_1976 [Brevibacterium sandarakinum]
MSTQTYITGVDLARVVSELTGKWCRTKPAKPCGLDAVDRPGCSRGIRQDGDTENNTTKRDLTRSTASPNKVGTAFTAVVSKAILGIYAVLIAPAK